MYGSLSPILTLMTFISDIITLVINATYLYECAFSDRPVLHLIIS